MNKKLIRLTESDLHRIVKESVNKVLNEIGDTPKGQFMLGAAIGRKIKNSPINNYHSRDEMSDYAKKKRIATYDPKQYEEEPWECQNDMDAGFNQGLFAYMMPDKYNKDDRYDVTDGLANRALEKWSKDPDFFKDYYEKKKDAERARRTRAY